MAQDLARRHPTMARLVATGIPLLGDGGAAVRRRCEEALERGPGPVAADALELMRYGLTDLLDDLADVRPGPEAAAVAIGVWRAAAELALACAETWNGTGKWLVRELQALDEREGDPPGHRTRHGTAPCARRRARLPGRGRGRCPRPLRRQVPGRALPRRRPSGENLSSS
ncbi:MAG TPA: hypothetical protein VFI40_07155 [Nocardioides sp.]|nr:hypothetical protein [Nocardioides sp.]